MTQYVLSRVAFLGLMLFGLLCLTFAISHVMPGDPARLAAGPDANQAMVDTLRAKYGLDRPLGVQFVRYLGGVLRGDLGDSVRTQQPVLDLMLQKLPVTVELALLAFVIALVIGIPAGIVSAVARGTAWDTAANATGRASSASRAWRCRRSGSA